MLHHVTDAFDDLEVPNDVVVGDCWLLETGKLAKYKLIEKSPGAKILPWYGSPSRLQMWVSRYQSTDGQTGVQPIGYLNIMYIYIYIYITTIGHLCFKHAIIISLE
jgi:hypothetical protein